MDSLRIEKGQRSLSGVKFYVVIKVRLHADLSCTIRILATELYIILQYIL